MPLLLLYPLFCFRMMGAGDIKLMAVLGGILGVSGILKGMFCAFILGAVLSLAFLISCGNLRERFSYFFHYLKVCKEEHCPVPYGKQGAQAENLHFTVPILLGIMLYAGGFVEKKCWQSAMRRRLMPAASPHGWRERDITLLSL
ncbi:MAG: prepilin peptidase [Blautia marasmi]